MRHELGLPEGEKVIGVVRVTDAIMVFTERAWYRMPLPIPWWKRLWRKRKGTAND